MRNQLACGTTKTKKTFLLCKTRRTFAPIDAAHEVLRIPQCELGNKAPPVLTAKETSGPHDKMMVKTPP